MKLEIKDTDDLCDKLNISKKLLKYILYVNMKNNYKTFKIPKKNGGYRTITAPNDDLKHIQQRLLKLLEENYDFLECQHGFIKGRSCITNAKVHTNRRFVLTCDIKDFFDTINFGRVRGFFMNNPFNFSNEVATTIAKITCYKNSLPQGAPTSPIISNMIFYSIDREYCFIAKKYHCRYTRYADDITFSSDCESFPRKIARIENYNVVLSNRVINNLKGKFTNGFVFNDSKTKLSMRYVRQEVTGIIVNKKTNLKRKYVNKIRAILYNIKKHGFQNTCNKTFGTICKEKEAYIKLYNYLKGKLNYLKMVKSDTDGLFLKYGNEFNEIFNDNIFNVTEEMRVLKYAQNRTYVITNDYGNGTAFSINMDEIITSTHVILDKNTYNNFITNKKSKKYKSQFPINDSNINFSYLNIKNLKNKKPLIKYNITKEAYESDILKINIKLDNKYKFKLSNNKVHVGDIVYLIGYPNFIDFHQTSLHIIKTKIIGCNTAFGFKILNTLESPKHGMSGGPVLNLNRELVGIVAIGYDDPNESDNVGFICLVDNDIK